MAQSRQGSLVVTNTPRDNSHSLNPPLLKITLHWDICDKKIENKVEQKLELIFLWMIYYWSLLQLKTYFLIKILFHFLLEAFKSKTFNQAIVLALLVII